MTEYIEIDLSECLETRYRKIYIDVEKLKGKRVLPSLDEDKMYGKDALSAREFRGEKE